MATYYITFCEVPAVEKGYYSNLLVLMGNHTGSTKQAWENAALKSKQMQTAVSVLRF